jgi:hypothetical protein
MHHLSHVCLIVIRNIWVKIRAVSLSAQKFTLKATVAFDFTVSFEPSRLALTSNNFTSLKFEAFSCFMCCEKVNIGNCNYQCKSKLVYIYVVM